MFYDLHPIVTILIMLLMIVKPHTLANIYTMRSFCITALILDEKEIQQQQQTKNERKPPNAVRIFVFLLYS